jgi:hypothetical protein
MNEVGLVTANFGGVDELRALPEHEGIDAFYYTDQATRAQADPAAVASWSEVLVPDYPRHDFGPRLRARYFKHQIHRLHEVRSHRWLVWADSSLEFHETGFILDRVEELRRRPPSQRVLVIPHPERNTVREEYEYICDQIAEGNEYLRLRYQHEKMTEQMKYFGDQGWDVEAGLWCGTFWMVERSEMFRRIWDDWWDQNIRFGMMDQLSLPVLLDHQRCDPMQFAISLRRNDHFTKTAHQRDM